MKTKSNTYTTNQTKIKIVCYYSHRKDGTPYTKNECDNKINYKVHDIFEFIYSTSNKVILRDDLSIKKCLRHLELYKESILTMLIIVNNFKTNQELRIGKYARNSGLKFTTPEYKICPLDGHRTISKVTVLKRDQLRVQVLNLNKSAA